MSWLFGKTKRPAAELARARLVVFDLETTGLDIRRDKPIAIGAVAIQANALALSDLFQARISQAETSNPQALLAHRLTSDELKLGQSPELALSDFHRYLAGACCFAYHSAFDDSIMRKACKAVPKSANWPDSIDIAQWIVWLHPELGPRPPTLDRALAYARIRRDSMQRHDALTDAWLTAQLALWLIPQTLQRGVSDTQALESALKADRKLRGMRS